jgi:hypothetical protein
VYSNGVSVSLCNSAQFLTGEAWFNKHYETLIMTRDYFVPDSNYEIVSKGPAIPKQCLV